ncbi:MAG TPA: FAD-linked oxidase C-terminal domain-containing protein [Actinomycetota bacterium]|nr:FAD-linked oxidase C-terminal domain-containing protein [Actinomycetota bacterium]
MLTVARELEAELERAIAGEVRFDDGSRALYSTDASNYRQVPIGVVLPRDVDDLIATVDICREQDAPILPRGGGTSLAGQCCNVAVLIDCSKYLRRVLDIDPGTATARVEPGVVLDDLQRSAEPHGLMYAPDPSTHSHCTLGGMIGNNSCGVHSLVGGRTSDNVVELDVLTADGHRLRAGPSIGDELSRTVERGDWHGDVHRRLRDLRDRYGQLIRDRFPPIPRRVSGFNLDELLPEKGFNVARALTGTEGTCATVLEATVRLIPKPAHDVLVVLGFPDVFEAADAVPEILAAEPYGLEGMDDVLLEDINRKGMHPRARDVLPEGKGWLLVEFRTDTPEEAKSRAERLVRARSLRRASGRIYEAADEKRLIWGIRESGLGATAFVPGMKDTWEGWEDSAAPPERLGDYLRELRALLERYRYHGAFYGHFGDGCLHTRIDFELTTAQGVARWRSFLDEAADLCVSYGGSLSGEHGDGQSRAELLPRMFGKELVEAFREFKAIWDPGNRMNPGKVVDPAPIASNLRLGTGYAPTEPETHFRFPNEGSFSRAALRCVGVGECRRPAGGVMCPSYMVTREEKHSTRGRARMLFEMLQGDVVRNGWRDENVKEALDLCLACKGCRTECPVNVDMATYKAEFMSHYFEGRLRPLPAYAMGLIPWWARLASRVPSFANALTQTPGLSQLVKRAAGLAPQRPIPRFAPVSFTRWFRRGHRPVGYRGKVILWPDTFNNYFHPAIAAAGALALEGFGYRVVIPPRPLCCGRPLYDFGMLPLAKRFLRKVLAELRGPIRAGVSLVGLEPSCVAVFRDELTNLFPDDEDAKRLAGQSFTFAEFLEREDLDLPTLMRPALVQRHCHHASVMGFDADRSVLAKVGIDAEVLDSGCCGLAGSFGFERDKYEIAQDAGERVLFPAVREAPQGALVLADGFSCREQINHGTGRRAIHLAQVVRMAQDNERRKERFR